MRYIGSRLREGHAGREKWKPNLPPFRLREADIERLHTRAERLEACGVERVARQISDFG